MIRCLFGSPTVWGQRGYGVAGLLTVRVVQVDGGLSNLLGRCVWGVVNSAPLPLRTSPTPWGWVPFPPFPTFFSCSQPYPPEIEHRVPISLAEGEGEDPVWERSAPTPYTGASIWRNATGTRRSRTTTVSPADRQVASSWGQLVASRLANGRRMILVPVWNPDDSRASAAMGCVGCLPSGPSTRDAGVSDFSWGLSLGARQFRAPPPPDLPHPLGGGCPSALPHLLLVQPTISSGD
jgi:hypothetical protein